MSHLRQPGLSGGTDRRTGCFAAVPGYYGHRYAHDVEEAILLASRVVVMSARPGRINEVIDIDIPYPRNQETKILPRFTELKNYIWQNVYKEYLEVQK